MYTLSLPDSTLICFWGIYYAPLCAVVVGKSVSGASVPLWKLMETLQAQCP